VGTSVFEASDVLPGPVTPSLSASPPLPEAGGLFCKYKKRQFCSLAQSGTLRDLQQEDWELPYHLSHWPPGPVDPEFLTRVASPVSRFHTKVSIPSLPCVHAQG
jgi:hypothetical protein